MRQHAVYCSVFFYKLVSLYADSLSCARTMSLMLMYATVANCEPDGCTGLGRAAPSGSESAVVCGTGL